MLNYHSTACPRLQGLFSKNTRKISGNSGNLPHFPLPHQNRFLRRFRSRAGIPALDRLVDEDDVVSDPLDAVPGDIVLLSPAEQAEKAGGAVNDQWPPPAPPAAGASTSPTKPRRPPSVMLMTSFRRSSRILHTRRLPSKQAMPADGLSHAVQNSACFRIGKYRRRHILSFAEFQRSGGSFDAGESGDRRGQHSQAESA